MEEHHHHHSTPADKVIVIKATTIREIVTIHALDRDSSNDVQLSESVAAAGDTPILSRTSMNRKRTMMRELPRTHLKPLTIWRFDQETSQHSPPPFYVLCKRIVCVCVYEWKDGRMDGLLTVSLSLSSACLLTDYWAAAVRRFYLLFLDKHSRPLPLSISFLMTAASEAATSAAS